MNKNKPNLEKLNKLYLDNLKFAPYKYKRVLTTDDPPNSLIGKIEGDKQECSEWCNKKKKCKMFLKMDKCYFYSSTNTVKSEEVEKLEFFVKNEKAFVNNIVKKKLKPEYKKFNNKIKDIDSLIKINNIVKDLIENHKMFDIVKDYYNYPIRSYIGERVEPVPAKFAEYIITYSQSWHSDIKKSEKFKDINIIKKELNLSKNKISKIKKIIKKLNDKFKIVRYLNNYIDKITYINNDFLKERLPKATEEFKNKGFYSIYRLLNHLGTIEKNSFFYNLKTQKTFIEKFQNDFKNSSYQFISNIISKMKQKNDFNKVLNSFKELESLIIDYETTSIKLDEKYKYILTKVSDQKNSISKIHINNFLDIKCMPYIPEDISNFFTELESWNITLRDKIMQMKLNKELKESKCRQEGWENCQIKEKELNCRNSSDIYDRCYANCEKKDLLEKKEKACEDYGYLNCRDKIRIEKMKQNKIKMLKEWIERVKKDKQNAYNIINKYEKNPDRSKLASIAKEKVRLDNHISDILNEKNIIEIENEKLEKEINELETKKVNIIELDNIISKLNQSNLTLELNKKDLEMQIKELEKQIESFTK